MLALELVEVGPLLAPRELRREALRERQEPGRMTVGHGIGLASCGELLSGVRPDRVEQLEAWVALGLDRSNQALVREVDEAVDDVDPEVA